MAIDADRRADRALALMAELSAGAKGALDREATVGSIGFDSLAFAELGSSLEQELGLDLAGLDLDEDSTVADVLRAVEVAGPVRSRDVPAGTGRLQRTGEMLGGWALRWWLRLEVRGAHHVPRTGPAVLAMNHESALDIPIIVVACPRRITFMAKRELYRNPFVSWSLRQLGGFKVDRERFDLPAVRTALAVIERGDVLGMYPEGTRAPGRLLPFLHGAAWIAVQTGAPIVPAGINGTERAGEAWGPGRVRVRVAYGPAVEVERIDDPTARRKEAERLTGLLEAKVARLRALA